MGLLFAVEKSCKISSANNLLAPYGLDCSICVDEVKITGIVRIDELMALQIDFVRSTLIFEKSLTSLGRLLPAK